MMLLFDTALRSGAVVGAALLCARLLRHRSATLRHHVLAAGIFCGAAVVPLSVIVPTWSSPVLPVSLSSTAHEALPVADANAASVDMVTTVTARATGARQWVVAVWISGVAAGLLLLLTAVGRLLRIASHSKPLQSDIWLQTAEQIATRGGLRRHIVLLKTNREDMIATIGLFRPRVLLPPSACEWTADRIRVVLSHEFAHIHRHDWPIHLIAELLRTIYWFNPLLWITCRQLRHESERACDDAVLETGVTGEAYATHLLDIARTCRHSMPTWAPSMSTAPSTLERRIAAMLNPFVDRSVPKRRLVLVVLLAFAAVAVAVAGVRAANQIAAQTLIGFVYDPTGAVLPATAVTLQDAQGNTLQAVTDASGRFEFGAIGGGRYALELSLLGFRPLRHEIELRQSSDWTRNITLQIGQLTETVSVTASRIPGPRTSARPAETPLRVGGNIRIPRKIVHVAPLYPAVMREAGLEGVVPIEALIGRDGTVVAVRVLSAGVHPEFAIAALDAVRQWQFSPTLLNGAPVEVAMTVSVRFSLTD